MGPNGYRTHLFPSLPVATLAIGMHERMDPTVDVIAELKAMASSFTAHHPKSPDPPRSRTQQRGIPFPAHRRRR